MESLKAYTIFATIFATLILVPTIRAQPAATAPTPAPSTPFNVTAILEKAGQFTTMIRLMKTSQVADQLDNQVNNSNSGVTLFAPTDNAFASLPPGTLNSLTDQQKLALLQFHILPKAVSIAQFQTVSNPLRTQAGDATGARYPLNVTTAGNQVNISTGVVNTTVSNTLYSDGQVAVYQVDKVLLPLALFGPAPVPAPAPAAGKSKRKGSAVADAPAGSGTKDDADASTAVKLNWGATYRGVFAFIVALGFFWWNF